MSVSSYETQNCRSSHPEMFYKKSVLKNFAKLTRNNCARASFLIKLQVSGLKLYLKWGSGTAFCEFCETFKNTLFAEHLRTNTSDDCKINIYVVHLLRATIVYALKYEIKGLPWWHWKTCLPTDIYGTPINGIGKKSFAPQNSHRIKGRSEPFSLPKMSCKHTEIDKI